MAQLQSGKYTVAWFKLAEFVIRKEKERALGIYRLLAHSLPNQGIASQLEGDLLLSFSDEKAIDAYIKASVIYEKDNKIVQAAALYEHLVTLQPYTLEYIYKMFKLYCSVTNEAKINKALFLLAQALTKHNKTQELPQICADLNLSLKYSFMLSEHSIVKLLSEADKKQADLYWCIDYTLDMFAESDSYLKPFLAKLKALNTDAYIYACDYLRK